MSDQVNALQQLNDQLVAALDAHKQTITELLNANLQLRANQLLFQKTNEQLNQQAIALQVQLSDANAKIAVYESPVTLD